MAEAVGLATGLLSLATLFSTCIDCFDFYKTCEDCGRDLRTSLVQLDLEKTRLLVWAENVGLVQIPVAKRHAELEKLEPSIRNALQEIKTLLAEANKVQERFGLEQRPEVTVSEGQSTDLVSRKPMATFRTNYKRFCAKYENMLIRPRLSLRLRWAVRDHVKFKGLINTLKDIVDRLFSLLRIDRTTQEEAMEVDILEMIDLSELHLVEEASEASCYPVLARAASIAIEKSESGTMDRRMDGTSTYHHEPLAPSLGTTSRKRSKSVANFQFQTISCE